MNRHLDPFYSAKLAFLGIHADIQNLKARTAAFIRNRESRSSSKLDPLTGEVAYRIRIDEDVPFDIERDAVRYLIEIRGALDKAVNGAAKILGSRSLKHTNFPFGDASGGEKAFGSQISNMKGPWRGIPDELHAYLLELQPYPSKDGSSKGNNLLALLGELSNPAKHENRLFVTLEVDGVYITKAKGNFYFPRLGAVWNEAHDEVEVLRVMPTSSEFEFAAPLQISFNMTNLFPDQDFSVLLEKMAILAEEIVQKIEVITSEKIAARNSRAGPL